jgi:hypothetical protein
MVGALRFARVVGPGEREVPSDERIPFRRDRASDANGITVDLVDLAGQPDRRELVVARVEGHRLEDLRAGTQELAVQLCERVGMFDDDLRREGPRLNVPTLLELEQVSPVAEHRTFREPLQDPFRHVSLLGKKDRVYGGAGSDGGSRDDRWSPATGSRGSPHPSREVGPSSAM